MNEQNSELQRVASSWYRGFDAIYRKELAAWFGTHRWINQTIIWMALTLTPAFLVPTDGTKERGIAVLSLFLWSGSNMMSIGTVILTQGAIVEEKLTQTLLWIFSKPLSPAGFILGKFAAYAVFIGAIVIGAPSIVVYIYATFVGLPASISIFNYAIGILMLYLVVLCVLALTIFLGVVFDKIAAVTALALTIFFSGASLKSNAQFRWIEPYTFWALQHNSYETMNGAFPSTGWLAMVSAVGSIGLLLTMAIMWMNRSEL
jgi:ABC-2 type transport system permease protein